MDSNRTCPTRACRKSWRNETVSDLQLERYLLGELTRGEAARIRRRLRLDETLKSRLSVLERSNGDILERYPPKKMAALVRKRLDNYQSSCGGKPDEGSEDQEGLKKQACN